MRRSITDIGMVIALAIPAWAAGGIQFPANLDNLAARATQSVNVNLDQSMLHLASGFLSKNDSAQEAHIKQIVSRLNSIQVRSFEFAKPGQYSLRDVAAIRAQLRKPEWTQIVGVQSKDEHTEIYVKKAGQQFGGFVVLDAEPKELTIVAIDGSIDPQELKELGGHMGIPKIGGKGMGLSYRSQKSETGSAAGN